MANRGELHSTRMDAANGHRYYFFNIKVDRHGALFMTIAESTKKLDGGFIRNELFLYEEDVERFGNEFRAVLRHFEDLRQKRSDGHGRIRPRPDDRDRDRNRNY